MSIWATPSRDRPLGLDEPTSVGRHWSTVSYRQPPSTSEAVDYLVSRLGALDGVRVEWVVSEVYGDATRWIIRAACESPERRDEAQAVLHEGWPTALPRDVVRVLLRVG